MKKNKTKLMIHGEKLIKLDAWNSTPFTFWPPNLIRSFVSQNALLTSLVKSDSI